MHIHVLGICGTFMGGIAALASAQGHVVSGSDANVYPPMSTQLENLGIELCNSRDLSQFSPEPDLVIIGNALSRGHPAVEYVLDRNIPYTSGPQWLSENLLDERWVLAVAGTHGKTSTTSMLAWILEYAGLEPGFLIGGIAENFQQSARLGQSPFFVIEADEYDSAFFDKRAKCVHYRPNTLVINNLEYDHADIYPDLNAIQTQLHHTVRTVPSSGGVIVPWNNPAISNVMDRGCWSQIIALHKDWKVRALNPDCSEFSIQYKDQSPENVRWSLFGEHNMHNAAMAIAAAKHVGVKAELAAEALAAFKNVKRRMELRGTINDIRVYDDFAHHPTAIKTTLEGAREHHKQGRIIAVIEARSNTMKMGVHRDQLISAWQSADLVLIKTGSNTPWLNQDYLSQSQTEALAFENNANIVHHLSKSAQSGDHVIVMSNGGFDNIHQQILETL